jgi:YD repeat-containing protein
MKQLITLTTILLLGTTSANAEPAQKRYYDARGNSLGTSSRDSQDTTTFYDARGRVVGKVTK